MWGGGERKKKEQTKKKEASSLIFLWFSFDFPSIFFSISTPVRGLWPQPATGCGRTCYRVFLTEFRCLFFSFSQGNRSLRPQTGSRSPIWGWPKKKKRKKKKNQTLSKSFRDVVVEVGGPSRQRKNKTKQNKTKEQQEMKNSSELCLMRRWNSFHSFDSGTGLEPVGGDIRSQKEPPSHQVR